MLDVRVFCHAGTQRSERAAAAQRDPQQEASPGVLRVIVFWQPMAVMARRYDLFFQTVLAEAPNVMLSEAMELYTPGLSADELTQLRTHPGAKDLLNTIRLPEYWDTVGWPDICRRVGRDDFECL